MIDLTRSVYNLMTDPFKLVSDYRFAYQHPSYKKALAYLKYAAYREEGFVMITGRPGTGKTTLINEVISGFNPQSIQTAVIVTTQLQADDILGMVLSRFRIGIEGKSKSVLLLSLEQYLERQHREGKRVILIIDEAQGLSSDAVEELRMLSNLQKDGRPLIQIFLVGQEELKEHIGSSGMEQLRQRIVAATHLEVLSEVDMVSYILHRMNVVGWQGDPAIEKEVVRTVYRYSEGIPRMVNLIMGRLLLRGCIEEKHILDRNDISVVIQELKQELLVNDVDEEPEEIQPYDQEVMPDYLIPLPLVPVGTNKPSTSVLAAPLPQMNSPKARTAAVVSSGLPHQVSGDEVQSLPGAADERQPEVNGRVDTGQDGIVSVVKNERMELTEEVRAEQDKEKKTADTGEKPQERSSRPPLIVTCLGLFLLLSLFAAAISYGVLNIEVRKEAMMASKLVASRISELDTFYSEKLTRLLDSHKIVSALQKHEESVIRQQEQHLMGQFLQATDVRLIAKSAIPVMSRHEAGDNSRLLAQLSSADSRHGHAPFEVYAAGSPEQHISVVRQVVDPVSNEIAGYLRLSLPVTALQDIFSGLDNLRGYMELRQTGMNGTFITIVSSGPATTTDRAPEFVRTVNQGGWQLAYWLADDRLDYLTGRRLWSLIALVCMMIFFIPLFCIYFPRRRK